MLKNLETSLAAFLVRTTLCQACTKGGSCKPSVCASKHCMACVNTQAPRAMLRWKQPRRPYLGSNQGTTVWQLA